MEYVFSMVSVIGVSFAFVSTTTDVLNRGIDAVVVDMGTSDSLSRTIGSPNVKLPDSRLDLRAGVLDHALRGVAYSFDFASLLSVPDGVVAEDLSWSLVSGSLPSGLTFVDGVISGVHNELPPAQFLDLVVEVTDGNTTVQENYVLTVRDSGVFLEPGTPSLVRFDEVYDFPLASFAFFPDGVANADAVWSIESGTFLPGLLLSPDTGVVSGVYTGFDDMSSSVTISVSANGESASETYEFSARGKGIELADSNFSWNYNTPVSVDFLDSVTTSFSVDASSIDWSIDFWENGSVVDVPPGLSVSGSTVSGIPLDIEDRNYTIRVVAESDGYRDEQSYSVSYTGSDIVFLGGSPSIVLANSFYSFSMNDLVAVSDSIRKDDLQWSIVSGSLPDGLGMDASGLISGTHTGLSDFTSDIVFRAQAGASFAQSLITMTVSGAAFVATPTTLPQMVYGQPFEFDFKDTLTTVNPFDFSTLSWTLSGSPLPSGIVFDSVNGVIEGIQTDLDDKFLNLLVVARDADDVKATAIHTVFVDGLEPFSIVSGMSSSCLLDQGRALWCLGSAQNGQLGNGSASGDVMTFSSVGNGGFSKDFVALDSSGNTVCGVKSDGDIWCWGEGSNGQLGNGSSFDSAVPVKVIDTNMGAAVDVAVGPNHVCAINETASVWCWGDEKDGRLGNGNTLSIRNRPVAVDTSVMSAPIVGLTAGDAFTCAWDENNAAWCWGEGGRGQLGNGLTSDKSVPVAVVSTSLSGVQDMSAGASHVCALDMSRASWCWGDGDNGRLGNGSVVDQSRPVSVDGSLGSGLLQLTSGNSHSCVVKANKEVWCWGKGSLGRLGNNGFGDHSSPVKVVDDSMGAVIGIGSGSSASHTCAWTQDREGWCWGSGGNGRLGNGLTNNSSVPVMMALPPL